MWEAAHQLIKLIRYRRAQFTRSRGARFATHHSSIALCNRAHSVTARLAAIRRVICSGPLPSSCNVKRLHGRCVHGPVALRGAARRGRREGNPSRYDRVRRWLVIANGTMGLAVKAAMLAWLIHRLV